MRGDTTVYYYNSVVSFCPDVGNEEEGFFVLSFSLSLACEAFPRLSFPFLSSSFLLIYP